MFYSDALNFCVDSKIYNSNKILLSFPKLISLWFQCDEIYRNIKHIKVPIFYLVINDIKWINGLEKQ